MAHEIDRLPGAGGRRKFRDYDWDKWMNGKIWTLEKGRDFDVKVTAMRAYVYRAARERGLTVKTVRTPGKLHFKALLDGATQ